MTEQELKELADKIEEEGWIEDVEGVEIIEEGDWIDEGTYDLKDTIIRYRGKTLRVREERTGSYYSDYDYSPVEIVEVESVLVTATRWVPKKDRVEMTTGKTRPPEEEEHDPGAEWGFAICEDAPMGTGGSHNGDPCSWCGRHVEE